MLEVKSRRGIVNYCKEKGIELSEFNEPVIIPVGVTDCSRFFEGCTSFDQPIIIPNGVRNCNYMFHHCTSYNSIVVISRGAKGHEDMFYRCLALDMSKVRVE